MKFQSHAILVLCLLMYSGQVLAQKEALIGAAGAAIAAGIGVAITAENVRDQLEANAANYVLNEYPEKECFELELLAFSASKILDPSNVQIIPFTISEMDKNTLAVTRREVLLQIRSEGWINEFGVDVAKIDYVMMDVDNWDDLFLSFLQLIIPPKKGGLQLDIQRDSIMVYQELTAKNIADFKDDPNTMKLVSKDENGWIRVKEFTPATMGDDGFLYRTIGECKLKKDGLYDRDGMVLPLRSSLENQFLVKDYSSNFKIVYSDESFGLFLKKTGELVKLRRQAANEIHLFLHSF